jgi:hypothetical protein
MPNLWRQFQDLLPDAPLLIGAVVARHTDGTATVELLDGGLVRARGAAPVGDRVFVRAGRVEGEAPPLPHLDIGDPMNAPNPQDGMVVMPHEEFEQLLEEAASRGAKRALADVGLDGETAAADIRELRGLLDAFHAAKRTAWQTVVMVVTTGFIAALIAGAALKLKLFGGTP